MTYCAETDILRVVFDAMPSIIFVVDEDLRIQDYNASASDLLKAPRSAIIKQRGGQVMHCLHATEVPEGCGYAKFCKDCIIRNSVTEAFQGNRIVRRRTKIDILQDGNSSEMYALITASPFLYKEKRLVLLVIEDISEITEIQRMIPICSLCKKVRDDEESWFRVETYFKKHWDVDFSHSLCPECYKIEMNRLEEKVKGLKRD